MSATQMRHLKLWYAGQSKNWQLTSYEVDELEEGFADAVRFHPEHKQSPRPLTELVPEFTAGPIAAQGALGASQRIQAAYGSFLWTARGNPRMTPGPGEYISLLMGAPTLSEADLLDVGVAILERYGDSLLGLLVPWDSIPAYKELVREHLQPGFWNDLVSPEEILFVFKLRDGTLEEFVLSDENREEVARLCSELNGDPLERTSDLPGYFAANPFYRDAMVAYHGATPE